jgi:hypothetical protein
MIRRGCLDLWSSRVRSIFDVNGGEDPFFKSSAITGNRTSSLCQSVAHRCVNAAGRVLSRSTNCLRKSLLR